METEHTLYYICKYTPLELLEGLGAHTKAWNDMPAGFLEYLRLWQSPAGCLPLRADP